MAEGHIMGRRAHVVDGRKRATYITRVTLAHDTEPITIYQCQVPGVWYAIQCREGQVVGMEEWRGCRVGGRRAVGGAGVVVVRSEAANGVAEYS